MRRAASLVSGWFLIAFAIASLLELRLGVAPFDVLNTAISEHLDVSFGTATWISASALLLLAWVLNAAPGPATFLGPFAIGALIDAFSGPLAPLVPTGMLWRWMLLAPALFVLYTGVCLVLLARLGSGPTEQLTVALVRRGVPLTHARWGIEAVCAASGMLAFSAVGPATLIVVLVAGPAISRLLPRTARLVGLDPTL